MSDEEQSRDELLDRTPEAVAMRRARAARAEAAAREAGSSPPPKRSRRGVVMAILGAVTAVGALSRMTGRGP